MSILTNQYGLPEPLTACLEQASVDRAETTCNTDYSATDLLSPPQIVMLSRRYKSEIREDVADRIAIVLGHAWHGYMEQFAPVGWLTEERFHVEMLGRIISGQVDLFDPAAGIVYDWKTTSAYAVINERNNKKWEEQLNIYAYLISLAMPAVPVKEIRIWAVMKDWASTQADGRTGYPPTAIVEVKLNLWPKDMQERFVTERVQRLIDAELAFDDELPECSAEDRWQTDTKHRIFKGKNKRATKICYSHEEALAYIEDAGLNPDKVRIEVEPGEDKRCQKFCAVRDFCQQYARNNAVEPAEAAKLEADSEQEA